MFSRADFRHSHPSGHTFVLTVSISSYLNLFVIPVVRTIPKRTYIRGSTFFRTSSEDDSPWGKDCCDKVVHSGHTVNNCSWNQLFPSKSLPLQHNRNEHFFFYFSSTDIGLSSTPRTGIEGSEICSFAQW